MKISLIIIGLVILGIAGWLIISETGGHQNMSPAYKTTKEKVPDFSLQDYNRETINLADFAGKPLVINSWAVWCPFCQKELLDFAVVQKELGESVAIIAVNRGESLGTAKQFTDEADLTDKLVFLLDPEDSFYRAIAGFSMPETIFVDKDGNIRDHKRGPMEVNEIRQRIQQILIKPR